ncbi:hypothetical protein [Kocuria tytonis]|uniref:hypothetical protein n=1 Tax=Kocuria tytonis TaxID=2054280 RepID=UPI001314FAB1|nr:hypothetical protein [Kocuria tytonis]
MTQHRTAVLAIAGSWLAVVIALLLTVFVARGIGVLLAFAVLSAFCITLFWARRRIQQE